MSTLSNITSLRVRAGLSQSTAAVSAAFERLSSGLRINRAVDDAAGLAVASGLTNHSNILRQSVRNLNDGATSLSMAEVALNELSLIVTRIEELATQFSSAIWSDAQRSGAQSEVAALQDEANRILSSTSLNGRSLLKDADSTTVVQGGIGIENSLVLQVGARQLEGGLEGFAAGTTRVSVSGSGTQANGEAGSVRVSADGRYVVFQSTASNLVSGDTGNRDIFRKDLLTGEVVRVNTTSAGAEANNFSVLSDISADGRYVVFDSHASNLVAGDSNGSVDIFRKDMLTGEVFLASTSSSGAQDIIASANPTLSADGRYIVFQSNASNDVFRKDTVTGETVVVNTTSSGVKSAGGAEKPSVSADGRYVVFQAIGAMVSDDTNGVWDIYRKDLITGDVVRVNTTSSGSQATGANSSSASISADGRYVVFESAASNLVTGDANGITDIFRKDILTGELVRVSTSSAGTEASGGSSTEARISFDGRYVVFKSAASNLVDDDSNGVTDIFRKDLVTGETIRVNLASNGVQASGGSSGGASISADGRIVAFDSLATNLVNSDTNGVSDGFVRDLSRRGIQEASGFVVSNRAAAEVTLKLAQRYREEISSYRGELGGVAIRLHSFLDHIDILSSQFTEAANRIVDVDVASEMSDYLAARVRQDLATAILSQANQAPRVVLTLLGD